MNRIIFLIISTVVISSTLNAQIKGTYLDSLYRIYYEKTRTQQLHPGYTWYNMREDVRSTTGTSSREYAYVLQKIAYYQLFAGNIDSVNYYMPKVFAIAKSYNDNALYGMCSFTAGVLNFLNSDMAVAEQLLKEAASYLIQANDPFYYKDLADINGFFGRINRYYNNPEKAVLFFRLQLQAYEELKEYGSISSPLTNLAGIYYMKHQYDSSMVLSKKAIDLMKQYPPDDIGNYSNALNILAGTYRDLGDYSSALPYARESLEILQLAGEENQLIAPMLAKSYLNLGDLYFRTGELSEAKKMYDAGMKKLQAIPSEKFPGYTEGLLNASLFYAETGRYDISDTLIQSAVKLDKDQIEYLLPTLSELEMIGYIDVFSRDYKALAFTFIKRKDIPKSALAELVNLRLQAKGVVLYSLAGLKKRIAERSDRDLLKQYETWLDLRQRVTNMNFYFLELGFDPSNANAGETLVDENPGLVDSSMVITKTNELEKSLTFKSGVSQDISDYLNYTWEDIKFSLGSGEAAIEFLYYNSPFDNDTNYYYSAFLIRKDSEKPVFVNLCTKDKIFEILSVPAADDNSYVKSSAQSSRLYNLVWEPLEKYLDGIKTVYFSSTGLLNKVSFDILQAPAGGMLMDKYSMYQVNSLNEAGKKSDPLTADTELSIALFGGFVYDADYSSWYASAMKYRSSSSNEVISFDKITESDNALISSETDSKITKWKYLPGTREEVENIAKLFKEKNYKVYLYEDTAAVEEAFMDLSYRKAPGIIHLATHGFSLSNLSGDEKNKLSGMGKNNSFVVSPDPTMRTGLIFSGGNKKWMGCGNMPGGIDDGVLTALEITDLDLTKTQLVVLSACETGLGDIDDMEGVFGLQRAFKQAGVKNIIVSLWKVPDAATKLFMTYFYENLLSGITTREAFENAQKKMRKMYTDDPFSWASFILIGS